MVRGWSPSPAVSRACPWACRPNGGAGPSPPIRPARCTTSSGRWDSRSSPRSRSASPRSSSTAARRNGSDAVRAASARLDTQITGPFAQPARAQKSAGGTESNSHLRKLAPIASPRRVSGSAGSNNKNAARRTRHVAHRCAAAPRLRLPRAESAWISNSFPTGANAPSLLTDCRWLNCRFTAVLAMRPARFERATGCLEGSCSIH